ncbi:hypothetical protein Pfo_003574 [Paulownia fortunei]|nr:hypothetical protein Pfo_003574 [Paulownia fortunei]
MLVAIGVDANQHVLSLAYAVVDEETFTFWRWFLHMLSKHIVRGVEGVYSILSARHGIKLFWRLDDGDDDPDLRLHYRAIHILFDIEFYGVYRCGYFDIDHHLITALIERWRSETHIFHFRVGEVTVTLQDVAVIWGLPIEGEPITGTDIKRSKSQWQQYYLHYLGFTPDEDHLYGSRIILTAIRDYLIAHPVTDDTPNVDVERYARGCVLILLGSVMYLDTSINKVSLLYLHHMEHIADCGRFSWGSAVLSFLYRELCNASARGKKDVGGATHLLQVNVDEDDDVGEPLRKFIDEIYAEVRPFFQRYHIQFMWLLNNQLCFKNKVLIDVRRREDVVVQQR